jgi:hypothetical protein
MLQKEINKGREVEEENVRSYQTTLRKIKNIYIYTIILKRKHSIALSEEATDLW